MGLNKHVDFSTAKLLKEKGFDEQCDYYYEHAITEAYNEQDGYSGPFGWEKGETNYQSGFHINNSKYDSSNEAWLLCSAPTIAEVVMWLYEKHGIWIRVTPIPYSDNITHWRWEHMPTKYAIRNAGWKKEEDYMSPMEAYEKAIEYCLNNLI